jgi:hypothetical protein
MQITRYVLQKSIGDCNAAGNCHWQYYSSVHGIDENKQKHFQSRRRSQALPCRLTAGDRSDSPN